MTWESGIILWRLCEDISKRFAAWNGLQVGHSLHPEETTTCWWFGMLVMMDPPILLQTIRLQSKPLLGVHSSPTFWQVEEEQRIVASNSGTQQRVYAWTPLILDLRCVPSSGIVMRRRFSPLMDFLRISFASGSILPWQRWQRWMDIHLVCFIWHSLRMEQLWPLPLLMKPWDSGSALVTDPPLDLLRANLLQRLRPGWAPLCCVLSIFANHSLMPYCIFGCCLSVFLSHHVLLQVHVIWIALSQVCMTFVNPSWCF